MSHSSNSSLLQLNRPDELAPQPAGAISQEAEERQYLETHESRHLPVAFRSRANSNSSEYPDQPVASTSSGAMYLNVDPTFYISHDSASARPERCEADCSAQLAAVKAGIVGKVIPREQWQPDESSALCTYPFCTAIFASTSSYFSLAPRRHHCRKCGKLYCASHSSSRALMYDESDRISQQRVCDMCTGKSEDAADFSRTSSRRASNASEVTTDASDFILTPGESTLSRISTRSGVISPAPVSFDSSLAPIEGWMDKDGVLSLYPLAHPSTARQTVVPAAGPLFAPSRKALRDAREREQTLTLRQRRMGGDKDMAPLKFGGHSFGSVSEEDEEEEAEEVRVPLPKSGLLRNKSTSSRLSARSHSRDKRIRIA